MTVSAFTIARSVVCLGYPIRQCVEALANVADEVVIGFDPTTDDGTYELCQELKQTYDAKLVESPWDMENRNAGTEIGRQTDIAMSHCSHDWLLHCQLDEAFHEDDRGVLREMVSAASSDITGFEFQRVCFYAALNKIRRDWTIRVSRLTRKGTHSYATLDGHNCVPTAPGRRVFIPDVWIYHYQRFGDPNLLSKRIRVLDGLFHPEENLPREEELKPYDFVIRNYDSFALDNTTKPIEAEILNYEGSHPKPFAQLYGSK